MKKIVRIRNSFKPLNKIELLKMDCRKHTTYNIKTLKTCIQKKNDQDCGKKNWKDVLFRMKKYTHIFQTKEVKVTNKVLREE